MRLPKRVSFTRLLQILAVAVVLSMILNPELSALGIFVDTLGLELLFLMASLQARSVMPIVALVAQYTAKFLCGVASNLGHRALSVYPTVARMPIMRLLVLPVLVSLSHGLRCRVIARAA